MPIASTDEQRALQAAVRDWAKRADPIAPSGGWSQVPGPAPIAVARTAAHCHPALIRHM